MAQKMTARETTMYFDRNRATLVASPDDLAALASHLTVTGADDGRPSPPVPEAWVDGNIADDGRIDPTVAGIVEIVDRPRRSVVLERFDGRVVDLTFVAWDRAGRVVMMDGAGGDRLAITATQFDLLPALLTQAVRLHPRSNPGSGPPIVTTAGAVELAMAGGAPAKSDGAGGDGGPASHLATVLGSLRHAWRVTGNWHGRPSDRSLTVLAAADEGLWVVEHGAADAGSTPGPTTPVRLTPITPAEITRLLGDVVTGRRSCDEPDGEVTGGAPDRVDGAATTECRS